MRTVFALAVPLVVAALAAAACTSSHGNHALRVTPLPPSPDTEGAAGTGLATGLPCDLQALVENRCIACHDGQTQVALLDFSDFTRPSLTQPDKTMADVALERMQKKEMPPPPAVPPEDDEIAAFADWIAAGTQENYVACTDLPPPAPKPPTDAGAPTDAGVVAADDAGAPPACTSRQTWSKGDEPSPLMHPGRACNACHQKEGGPNLRIAGTVYPSAHEPNDCVGSGSAQIHVVITDARSAVFDLPVNASGNFLTPSGARPKAPFRAKLVDGTKTRSMKGSVTSGDCNSCHTANGVNGAPGRILAP